MKLRFGTTQFRAGYATFERDGHIENHKIDSEDFEHWLADKFGDMHQREINGKLEPTYPSKQDLKDAIWQIQGYAKEGKSESPRSGSKITEVNSGLTLVALIGPVSLLTQMAGE